MTDRDRTGGRLYFPFKPSVRVLLSCGCWVKTRTVPLPDAHMGCTSGQAHGYRLHWVEAITENGRQHTNRRFQKGKP